MELTSLIAFAAIVSLAIAGNADAIVKGIDLPYRQKVVKGEATPVNQDNPTKLRALSEHLPARMMDCKAHGNCLYFKMQSVETEVFFIWKLILKQGAGVDWFNPEEATKFPGKSLQRKKKDNGKEVEYTMSRVAAILEFEGLEGEFRDNSLYVIDCRNYINQVEASVLMGERVDEAFTMHGDKWLSYYLKCPNCFYQPLEWITMGMRAVMACKEDVCVAEFFCSNYASLPPDEDGTEVKVEMWAGLGYYIRSEWLGRWAVVCNYQKIKDDSGENVLWSPICPVSLLKSSKEAIRILFEMLPVFLKHELVKFGKYCTQKVYNAKKMMEYYIYHLLIYGQGGCLQLEKALKMTGLPGKYGHSRVWIHGDYGLGLHKPYLDNLLSPSQGWVKKKLDKKIRNDDDELYVLGAGSFRCGGKIGVGLLAFHIHSDAVELSAINRFWGFSQSLSPKQYVEDGRVVDGLHPKFKGASVSAILAEEDITESKTYEGLNILVPSDKDIFKTDFCNVGKFIHNDWKTERWWLNKPQPVFPPLPEGNRRRKRKAKHHEEEQEETEQLLEQTPCTTPGWTLSLESYISHSRKDFVYTQHVCAAGGCVAIDAANSFLSCKYRCRVLDCTRQDILWCCPPSLL